MAICRIGENAGPRAVRMLISLSEIGPRAMTYPVDTAEVSRAEKVPI